MENIENYQKLYLDPDEKRNALHYLGEVRKWSDLQPKHRKIILDLRYNDLLSEDQFYIYMKLIWNEEKESIPDPDYSAQEEAFRRGFSHGVIAAQNGVTPMQAEDWRRRGPLECLPGTAMEGVKLDLEELS